MNTIIRKWSETLKITLDKLPINEIGKITKLKVNDGLKRRLQDLGLIENTMIKAMYKSPLKDPTAYKVRGSIIALRKNDTKNIYISYDENNKYLGDYNGIN